MTPILLFLSLFALAKAQSNTNTYESVCVGQLGYLYAFGGSKCNQTGANIACKCTDPAFGPSVVSCIDQLVTEIEPVTEQNIKSTLTTAYQSFISQCPQYSLEALDQYHANASSLPAYKEDTSGTRPGFWPVNGAFAPTQEEIRAAYRAYTVSNTSVGRNNRYGAVLLAYWGLVVAIQALLHYTDMLLPTQLHSIKNSWPGRMLRRRLIADYRPISALGLTMTQFLAVVGYVALVCSFSFADLPVSYPSYTYLNSNAATYGSALGKRVGVLFIYIMPLFILFAGRNNFLQWLTGWPIGPFLTFHKWIARVGVLMLLVHAIALSIARAALCRYGSIWNEAFWRWGVVGFSFGAFLFVQAFRFLRHRAYDAFVVLHIIGVIMFLCAGYHHVRLLQIPGLPNFFFATFAVWGFDRLLRAVRMLLSGVHEPATIELKHDILVVTIKTPRHWNLQRNPGMYVFVHFWEPAIFWQSHPFTLVDCAKDPGHLKLFCKVHTGATRRIANRVIDESENQRRKELLQLQQGIIEKTPTPFELDTPSSARPAPGVFVDDPKLQIEMRVLLDGPYGHSHNLAHFDEIVFIAGGTGISGPFDYLQSRLRNPKAPNQRIRLFWAVRSHNEVQAWFQHELEFLGQYKLVEVNICSRTTERLDVASTIARTMMESAGSVAIMCCGPPAMVAQARNAFADSLPTIQNHAEYLEERVSW